MYSDQLIKGGDYEYEFVPMEKTMRAPQGEPVVNLSQNGQLVSSFMPEKGEYTPTTPSTPTTPTTQNIDSNNSFMR